MPLGIDNFASTPIQGRGVLIDIERHRVRLKNYFPVARFGASYYVRTRDRFSLDAQTTQAAETIVAELAGRRS